MPYHYPAHYPAKTKNPDCVLQSRFVEVSSGLLIPANHARQPFVIASLRVRTAVQAFADPDASGLAARPRDLVH
jgi:hypothetical protein